MYKGMHHYGIACRKLEESVAFYCDHLGFEVLSYSDETDGEDAVKVALLKCDTFVLALFEPSAWGEEACEWASGGLNHIALACGNAAVMAEKLQKEAGIEFESTEEGPDCDCLFLRGPGGERIEIFEIKSDMFPVMYSPNSSDCVRGFAHVGVFSGDYEGSIKFYQEVLGFEHLFTFEEGGPDMDFWNKVAFLRRGDALLEILCPIQNKRLNEMIKYQARIQMSYLAMELDCDISEAVDSIRSKADLEWENTEPVASTGMPEGKNVEWVAFRDINGFRWKLVCSV